MVRLHGHLPARHHRGACRGADRNADGPRAPRRAAAGIAVAMISNGTVTLGNITDTITMLDVACDRCERRGRLRVAGLIAQHCAEMGLPELRHILASDCPRAGAVSLYNQCGI